jgi:hypothetical protein
MHFPCRGDRKIITVEERIGWSRKKQRGCAGGWRKRIQYRKRALRGRRAVRRMFPCESGYLNAASMMCKNQAKHIANTAIQKTKG